MGNITGGHKIAKNCLTVANVMLNGMIDPTSSRGPTKDGRMKPEVSARGNSQLSTNSNNTYQVGEELQLLHLQLQVQQLYYIKFIKRKQ